MCHVFEALSWLASPPEFSALPHDGHLCWLLGPSAGQTESSVSRLRMGLVRSTGGPTST
jgi:hypothetical protein